MSKVHSALRLGLATRKVSWQGISNVDIASVTGSGFKGSVHDLNMFLHVLACSHGCFFDTPCPHGKCEISALDLYQFHMHTRTRFCVFFQLQLLSRVLAHILATLDATLGVLAIALGLYWHGRDMIYR